MTGPARNRTLRVRCTEADIRAIDSAARAAGFDTRSEWVRAASRGDTTVILACGPVSLTDQEPTGTATTRKQDGRPSPVAG